MLTLRTCLFLTLAAACGPKAPMTTATAGDTSTGDPGTSTSSPTSTSASTSSTATSADPTTGAGSSSGDTLVGFMLPPDQGVPFIIDADGGSCVAGPHDGQRCTQCDTWTQNCPKGEKCNPWANDGGDQWNAHRCVPLAVDPAHAGEPCTVEGGVATGIDSCDIESTCWHVDPQTLTGVCVLQCDGSPDAPSCPDGTSCLIANDGVLALCLPTCDPLAADCPGDDRCALNAATETDFVCVPDQSGDQGQVFDPCEFQDACDPGLACVESMLATECDQDAGGCCLPFCDTTEPPACPGAMQQCLPWFAVDPPAGLEHVGVCGIPQ